MVGSDLLAIAIDDNFMLTEAEVVSLVVLGHCLRIPRVRVRRIKSNCYCQCDLLVRRVDGTMGRARTTLARPGCKRYDRHPLKVKPWFSQAPALARCAGTVGE